MHPLVPASENELRIPFAYIDADPALLPTLGPDESKSEVILALIFNPANCRLAAAHVRTIPSLLPPFGKFRLSLFSFLTCRAFVALVPFEFVVDRQ
jgi:hypothetical protein